MATPQKAVSRPSLSFQSPSSGFISASTAPVLLPHLKHGQTSTSNEPPTSFQTKVGKLLVPRQIDPPLPTPDMIFEARRGNLTSFFRSGKYLRASDFVGDVSAKTGKMNLEEKYEYQSRPLSVLNGRVTEQEKSLRCLFYVALDPDELPSYHFWIATEEGDPIEAAQELKQKQHLEKTRTSPMTTAKMTPSEGEPRDAKQNDKMGPEAATKKQSSSSNDNKPSPIQTSSTIPESSLLQGSSAMKTETSSTPDQVLLRFGKGGKYLTDFDFLKFVETTKELVEREEEDPSQDKDMRMFIDIQEVATKNTLEHQISSNRKHRVTYPKDIKPFLGKMGFNIRVRSSSLKGTPFDSYAFKPTVFKVVRRGVGYYYVDVDWNDSTSLTDNSDSFLRALNLLYPEDAKDDEQESIMLAIPGHGNFCVNRATELMIDEKMQARFATIAGSEKNTRATEIFVYRINEAQEPATPRFPQVDQHQATATPSQVPHTQKDQTHDHAPGRQECPFQSCKELLETNKTSPDYWKVEAHLNGHFVRRPVTDSATQSPAFAHRVDVATQSVAQAPGINKATQATVAAPASGINKGTQATAPAPALGINKATQATALPSLGINKATQATTAVPAIDAETQTAAPAPASQAYSAPASERNALPEAPTKADNSKALLYCSKCLTSVDKLGEAAKQKHAAKCDAAFVHHTTQEAKLERLKRRTALVSSQPAVAKKRKAADENGDEAGMQNPLDESARKKAKVTDETELPDPQQPVRPVRAVRKRKAPTEEPVGELEEVEAPAEGRRTRRRVGAPAPEEAPAPEAALDPPSTGGRKRRAGPAMEAGPLKKARTRK